MNYSEWERKREAERQADITRVAEQRLENQRFAERNRAMAQQSSPQYLQEDQVPKQHQQQSPLLNYYGVFVFLITVGVLIIGLVIVRFIFQG